MNAVNAVSEQNSLGSIAAAALLLLLLVTQGDQLEISHNSEPV